MPRRTPHPCYKQPQNRGLSCDEGEDKCEKCGWNPDEFERRLRNETGNGAKESEERTNE